MNDELSGGDIPEDNPPRLIGGTVRGPTDWIAPVPTRAETVAAYPELGDDFWADSVDKQLKQLKMGLAASFGLAALAIGMAGLLGKAVNSLMQGLNGLAENQAQLHAMITGTAPDVKAPIPMPAATPPPAQSSYAEPAREAAVNTDAVPVPSNTTPKDRSIPDPTVDASAEVAEPASGPGGEASQRVKDLLAADGPMSMKDVLPDPLAVSEAAVNEEAKHADVRHQS